MMQQVYGSMNQAMHKAMNESMRQPIDPSMKNESQWAWVRMATLAKKLNAVYFLRLQDTCHVPPYWFERRTGGTFSVITLNDLGYMAKGKRLHVFVLAACHLYSACGC